MNDSNEHIRNVADFLEGLSSEHEFQITGSYGKFDLVSSKCTIRMTFDRYESDVATIEFINPNRPANGMALWMLCQIRSVKNAITDADRPFYGISRTISANFSDLLCGDFSIQGQYEQLRATIFDKSMIVFRLPSSHPTRIKFDTGDISWLNDIA